MNGTSKRIFLSYGHDHYADIALQLKIDLEHRGYDVWFDLDRLRAGIDHVSAFVGRHAVLQDINHWLDDQAAPKLFWLAGLPGTGKTAIASWLCHQDSNVAAVHFCRFTNTYSLDPRRFVMSLAYQLAMQIPDFLAALLAADLTTMISESQSNIGALADEMIVKNLPAKGARRLIVVDGLDEATANGSNAIARLIKNHLARTPNWLKILVTSRPEPEIRYELQAFTPRMLDAESPENQADAREYICRKFARYALDSVLTDDVINNILKRSEGSFLYLNFLGSELAARRLTLSNADAFPQGLG